MNTKTVLYTIYTYKINVYALYFDFNAKLGSIQK